MRRKASNIMTAATMSEGGVVLGAKTRYDLGGVSNEDARRAYRQHWRKKKIAKPTRVSLVRSRQGSTAGRVAPSDLHHTKAYLIFRFQGRITTSLQLIVMLSQYCFRQGNLVPITSQP